MKPRWDVSCLHLLKPPKVLLSFVPPTTTYVTLTPTHVPVMFLH